MSMGEILVIMGVAVIVLGPKQLPIMLNALGKLVSLYHQGRAGLNKLLDDSLQEQQLDDNLKKAQEADELYKSKE